MTANEKQSENVRQSWQLKMNILNHSQHCETDCIYVADGAVVQQ